VSLVLVWYSYKGIIYNTATVPCSGTEYLVFDDCQQDPPNACCTVPATQRFFLLGTEPAVGVRIRPVLQHTCRGISPPCSVIPTMPRCIIATTLIDISIRVPGLTSVRKNALAFIGRRRPGSTCRGTNSFFHLRSVISIGCEGLLLRAHKFRLILLWTALI